MELILLVVVVTSVWVYFDARALGARRGLLSGLADMGPAGWFLASLLLWIVGFPMYLAKRSEIKEQSQRQSSRGAKSSRGR